MDHDTQYRKQSGYEGEEITKSFYESKGYVCKDQNFTVRGGEIDLVMENDVNLTFVECKVVNYVENLHDYITPKKLQALKYSIDSYLWKYPTKKLVRIDAVFIKDKKIVQIYKNVEI